MKHLVLSNAWKYSAMALAYKITFGHGNSQCAFLPLVNIKPTRQLIASDGQGGYQLVADSVSKGDTAFSVLALPQDQFGYIQDRRTGDLTLLKRNTRRSSDCLLFVGCRNCTFVDEDRTSGHVLAVYRRLFDEYNMLEIVALLKCNQTMIAAGSPAGYIEYTWNGRILFKRECR